MSRSLQIPFVVLLGAFIGALIAKEFDVVWWPLGSLIGGVFAYVAYAPKRWIIAIKDAWQAEMASRTHYRQAYHRTRFARKWIGLRQFYTIFAWPQAMMFWMSLIVFGPFAVVIGVSAEREPVTIAGFALAMPLLFSVYALLVSVSILNRYKKDRETHTLLTEGYLNLVPEKWNIFVFPFSSAHVIARWIKQWIKRTPADLRKAARFIGAVMVRVHSTERVVCFMYAALGAAIGFHLGSPLIGAIAGAGLSYIGYRTLTRRAVLAQDQSD